MTIDWLTLVAQLFNFALLLVLLRIFLYRPVLKIMDEREALATSVLDEARTLRAEAVAERAALAAERDAAVGERAARRETLGVELEQLRRERVDAVTREAAALRAATAEALEQEVDRTTDRLRTGLSSLVLEEVRQTLKWLAGAELEQQAVSRFLSRLGELPEAQRTELTAAAAEGVVRLTTAQPLADGMRDVVRRVVADVLGVTDVDFRTDEALVVGALLETGGLRLDGSAAARLETLGERFADALADLRDGTKVGSP